MTSRQLTQAVIINGDNRNLGRCHFNDPVRFSIDTASAFQAKDINYHPFHTTFHLHDIHFRLSMPGKYNLYNAMSCIALLSETGISLKDIAENVRILGIEHRFDIHLNDKRRLVIDDYAHNPHKNRMPDGSHKRNKREGLLCLPAARIRANKAHEARIYRDLCKASSRPGPSYPSCNMSIPTRCRHKDISSEDLMEGIKTAGFA